MATPESDVQARVLGALEDVIDPELGIDIVNLGLIYHVDVDDDGQCDIQMTLTTMGCPLSDMIYDAMVTTVEQKVPEVTDVDIQLVWYPQWTPAKMSRYARIALGISTDQV